LLDFSFLPAEADSENSQRVSLRQARCLNLLPAPHELSKSWIPE
jgi:hypothetical protein